MAIKNPWHVAQYGAREHYAVPRALHKNDALKRLYTDVWLSQNRQWVGGLGGPFKHIAGRYHPEINSAGIEHWTYSTLCRTAFERIIMRNPNPYQQFTDSGIWFSRKVATAIRRESSGPGIFFSYDTTFLEAAHEAAIKEWKTVVCQTDPARIEQQINLEEEKRWPNWVGQSLHIPESYNVRRAEEWRLADRVIVNSTWTRDALVKQGVASDKIRIVPLCYEKAPTPASASRTLPTVFSKEQPLRVLFLGLVVLRKGIQYLCEAARLLSKEPVAFDIVGPPLGITQSAIDAAPPNVRFHGRASRNEVQQWYQQAHVFVLPTLSDGFALTQLEAMAHGLPVIATPNCASVVRPDCNGMIVPIRDAQALADAIVSYLHKPQRLHEHGVQAMETIAQYSPEHLQTRLAEIATELE